MLALLVALLFDVFAEIFWFSKMGRCPKKTVRGVA